MLPLTEIKALVNNLSLALASWAKYQSKDFDAHASLFLEVEIIKLRQEIELITHRVEEIYKGVKNVSHSNDRNPMR